MMPLQDSQATLSVSELNHNIKRYVETHAGLQGLSIKGQVSNHRQYGSGHAYFNLVDLDNSINCVLFKGNKGHAYLENGAQVVATGSVTFYERRGQINLNVQSVEPFGKGALQKEFEVLYAKLDKEGLFEQKRKRPIPPFPSRIAVVTSAKSAAFADVTNVLRSRYPLAELLVIDATVGGETAVASLISGLKQLPDLSADLCLLVRGGGADEELWPYNDENLVRTIFAAPIPVVTGIGHEINRTIADFVADMSAPTPSAAAERVTPDKVELNQRLAEQRGDLVRELDKALLGRTQDIDMLADRLRAAPISKNGQLVNENNIQKLQTSMGYLMQSHADRMGAERARLTSGAPNLTLHFSELHSAAKQSDVSWRYNYKIRSNQLRAQKARIDALSPYSILSRGYSIIQDSGGAVVKSSRKVKSGDNLSARLHSGKLEVTVASAEHDKAK